VCTLPDAHVDTVIAIQWFAGKTMGKGCGTSLIQGQCEPAKGLWIHSDARKVGRVGTCLTYV
jgi:hypothetical protein